MRMRTKAFVFAIGLVLFVAFFVAVPFRDAIAAKQTAKQTSLKKKQVTLTQGSSHTISLKNKKKKAKYSFRSSNAKVASVSKKGRVKANKKGTAKITVKQTLQKKTKKVGTLKVVVKAKKKEAAQSPKQVPLYVGPMDQFPSSKELPEGAISIRLKDGYASNPNSGAVQVYRDVLYDERDGEELSLHVLLPKDSSDSKNPLIVYIPGSAWMRQNTSAAIPQMTRVAERGYTVAIVEYRGTDVAPFPAQAEDAKTAIRFLRKHAQNYQIDPDKAALWGDSSGGHTAVLAGVTGDGTLDNMAYGEYSSQVDCIIDWYGPTDVSLMNCYPSMMDHTQPNSPEGMLLGGVNVLKKPKLAQKANPLNYITAQNEVPATLIMHGSRDPLVPFNQSVILYNKLRSLGKEVQFYKLEDAFHGSGGFAGDGALNLVLDFLARQWS